MRLVSIISLVLLAGCIQQPQPVQVVPPPAPAVSDTDRLLAALQAQQQASFAAVQAENNTLRAKLDASADECSRLSAESNRFQQQYAEAEAASHYTGIRLLTDPPRCPPCRRIPVDFAAGPNSPKAKGWTMGDSPNNHIWTVSSPDIFVPRFQIMRDGVVEKTIKGYDGDIWGIVNQYPKGKKAFGSAVTESPIYTETIYRYDAPVGDVLLMSEPVYTEVYTAPQPRGYVPTYQKNWVGWPGFGFQWNVPTGYAPIY